MFTVITVDVLLKNTDHSVWSFLSALFQMSTSQRTGSTPSSCMALESMGTTPTGYSASESGDRWVD